MKPFVRAVAIVLGLLVLGGGVAAVFLTSNELGTAALLIVGGLFLVCGVFGLVPQRLRIGGQEVEVGQAALATLERVVGGADPNTQERALETLEEELAERGIVPTQEQAVDSTVGRFTRFTGSSEPQRLREALSAEGWTPSTPPRSSYVLWTYAGSNKTVRLYQNAVTLVASSQKLVPTLRRAFPAAEYRDARGDLVFNYVANFETAISAAQAAQALADQT